jgi:voltage-gated potassium channel Kch
MLVVAVDGEERILNIVRLAQKHFPQLTIMARAHGRTHEYELLKAGVPHVYRETMGSSMELGTDALTLLGLRAHQAHRFAKAFRRMDVRMVHELLEHWGKGDGAYIAGLRERVTAINDLFDRYRQPDKDHVDGAWDTESLREEITGTTKPSA